MQDYHIHCHFCRHASGRLDDYALAARARGIPEICFTPHIPLPGFRPGFWRDGLRMDESEFDAYLEELEETRRRFPDLLILSGIEADYIAGMERFLERFLSSHEFDFVLMSVHFIASWPGEEWVFAFNPRRALPSVYRDYFREVKKGAETGLFDCAAHLDLIKQPGKPVLDTNRADVEETLEALAGQGMSIEINTSGARKGVPELYPCDDIVRLALKRGIPLVTGSDAHDPSQVGIDFEALGERFGPGLASALVRYRQRHLIAPAAASKLRGWT